MAAEIPALAMLPRTGAAPVLSNREETRLASAVASALPDTLPSRHRRALRVAGVAAAWGLGVLPAMLGQRCTMAMFFHLPCPGCGMTRAARLLATGHVEASLEMHPLALPVVGVWALLMATTLWTTWTLGTPLAMVKGRLGRVALAVISVVYAAVFVLWILRWFGLFGGPVSVA